MAVDRKSNEIAAIPLLLERLDLKGCVVTSGARGCQTEIAAAKSHREADSVLAVKDNQPGLHAVIHEAFVAHAENGFADAAATRLTTVERGHAPRGAAGVCGGGGESGR